MSLSHRRGGILAHSSLQNCCNAAVLEGFFFCMNYPFKITPQHLNWILIRVLTWPLRNLYFVFFLKPFSWIIVVLHDPRVSEFDGTNPWPDFLLQDFPTDCRIHCSICHGALSWFLGTKAAPDQYTATTTLHS